MASLEYSIAARSLQSGWGKLGADQAISVVPESITHTSEVVGGPASLSFTLKRDTRVPWPDLTPFTPIACTVGGVRCWSGRIMQTPTQRGNSSEISVTAQGYWSHLSDDPIDKIWVIQDISRFYQSRTHSSVNMARFTTSNTESIDERGITFNFPAGFSKTGTTIYAAATLDMGPNNLASRVLWDYVGVAVGVTNVLYCRVSTSADPFDSGSNVSTISGWAASGTNQGGTAGTPARYVHFFCYQNAATAAFGADTYLTIKNVRIFTDAAYESGNASALKASTVISEALALGCDTDIIAATDVSGITTTAFNISEYGTPGRRTVAEIIEDVNAYHGYQAYLTTDPLPRLIFRAVPTIPTYVVNDSDGYEFQNASANDASEIYNRIRLKYTQGDGTPSEVVSTPSTDTTFVGKRGFNRTLTIEVRSKLSTASAQQIADVYRDLYVNAPLKGSVSVKGTITRYSDGARVPVGVVQAGDVLLIGNESDPQTGARGRQGEIAQVSYTHDDQSLSMTLDSRRDYLDQLLARIPS